MRKQKYIKVTVGEAREKCHDFGEFLRIVDIPFELVEEGCLSDGDEYFLTLEEAEYLELYDEGFEDADFLDEFTDVGETYIK